MMYCMIKKIKNCGWKMKILIKIWIIIDFLWNVIRIKENYYLKMEDVEIYLYKKCKEIYYMF